MTKKFTSIGVVNLVLSVAFAATTTPASAFCLGPTPSALDARSPSGAPKDSFRTTAFLSSYFPSATDGNSATINLAEDATRDIDALEEWADACGVQQEGLEIVVSEGAQGRRLEWATSTGANMGYKSTASM